MHKMQHLQFFSYITLLLLYCNVSRALDCQVNDANEVKVAYTITVDKSGQGNFTTIQQAIDSIPSDNSQWIRIQIPSGSYKEKVTIQNDKTCIFLEGAGKEVTSIEWNDHESTATSATFTAQADNLVVKGIAFKNTFNGPFSLQQTGLVQAVAAQIEGDKNYFYQCGFFGVQDTLWDVSGRHYFHESYFQGGIDFIFGNGQSLYEKCDLNYSMGEYEEGIGAGFITAQGRESEDNPGGFVFKHCKFTGRGKAYLGRAWKEYSRVIVANSDLSDIIVPVGWEAWNNKGNEGKITYVEVDNTGPGADTSKRIPWLKKWSKTELDQFLGTTFNNQGSWLSKRPIV